MVEQMKASGVKESEEATVLVHVSTLASTTISDRLNSIMANWGKLLLQAGKSNMIILSTMVMKRAHLSWLPKKSKTLITLKALLPATTAPPMQPWRL